jgi:uncharacterized protein (UPF0332 family)
MDERDFLALAQRLANEADQAAWRSAVSRAYYAAFHRARRLMESLGFTVPRAERAHSYLWLRLHNCGHRPVQREAANLNVLRGLRNQADYDLTRGFQQALAQAYVQVAAQVIQTLDAIPAPSRAQITDEMRRYERDVLKDVTWHP